MKKNEMPKKKNAGRRFMIIFLIVVLVFLPVSNAIGYEMVFHFLFLDEMRDIEKNEAEEKSFLEAQGLVRTTMDITTASGRADDEKQAGKLKAFLYMTKEAADRTGGESLGCENLIVFSHGIGNGHIAYLDLLGELAGLDNTAVLAYDATGNGQSDGKANGGLPQGIKDLDRVLNYVESDPYFSDADITLVGHSWGAYSAGSVLEFHPEIEKAVLIAGFNASENMLQSYSQKYVGPVVYVLLPYVELYEMIKFGRFGNASIVRGCLQSGTSVTYVQALDDARVDPEKFGLRYLQKELSEDEDVTFIELESGGHTLPVPTVMEIVRPVVE